MKRAITKGGYGSTDQFIRLAIDNQIRDELEGSYEWPAPVSNPIGSRSSSLGEGGGIARNLLSPPNRTPVIVGLPAPSMVSQLPLWGQLYKFLPTKVGLRILANLTQTSNVSYKEFRETAAKEAVLFKRRLAKKDRTLGNKFGGELSTAFPDNNDKSINRYEDQYLVYARPSVKQISSLAAQMRWLSVDAKRKVGITKLGLEFAKLPSPIIDGDGEEPLSREERNCIIDQLITQYRAEALQMEFVLREITSGVSSRQGLNDRIVQFYRKSWPNECRNWREGVFNTMRAGEISRLYELGLISKTRDGLMVTYSITEEGERVLERLRRPPVGIPAR
jgi:DNA-binding transcriptional ArsR family regulator